MTATPATDAPTLHLDTTDKRRAFGELYLDPEAIFHPSYGWLEKGTPEWDAFWCGEPLPR
jgi:hypothetical protein